MIQASNFRLRHVRKEDIPRLIELLNHPDSKGDYLSLELVLPGVAQKKFEDELYSKELCETFLIVNDDDTILGRVFHFKTVPYFNSREIGYALFAKHLRGKGIIKEAVQLVVDYLFNTTLLNRLEIHMNVDNIASERVAQRCGFTKDGIAKAAVFSRGKHVDVAMYSLLRADWVAQRSVLSLPS